MVFEGDGGDGVVDGGMGTLPMSRRLGSTDWWAARSIMVVVELGVKSEVLL